MIQARFDVERSVDIWSLGCVLSEAATWSVHGRRRLLEYRRHRRKEVQDILGSGAGDAFHDGSRVLPAVVENHVQLKQISAVDDHSIIPEIITLLSNMIDESKERLSSRTAYQRSMRIIQRANDMVLENGRRTVIPQPHSASITLADESSIRGRVVLEHSPGNAESPFEEDQLMRAGSYEV